MATVRAVGLPVIEVTDAVDVVELVVLSLCAATRDANPARFPYILDRMASNERITRPESCKTTVRHP